MVIVIQL